MSRRSSSPRRQRNRIEEDKTQQEHFSLSSRSKSRSISPRKSKGRGIDPDGIYGSVSEQPTEPAKEKSKRRERTATATTSTSLKSTEKLRSKSKKGSTSGTRASKSTDGEEGHTKSPGVNEDVYGLESSTADRQKSAMSNGVKRKDRLRSRSKSEDENFSMSPGTLTPSARRSRIVSSYLKSPNYNHSSNKNDQAKHKSDDRKSDIKGSLTAFLDEGKAATPSRNTKRKDEEDYSVISSISKIQRRKSRSTPRNGVTGSDALKQRQRSRSSSLGPLDILSKKDEITRKEKKAIDRVSSVRSRTPSARSRDSTLHRQASQGRNKSNTTQPLDHPLEVLSPGQRQRKAVLGTGAEVPPGFPALAVDHDDTEMTGHSSGPTVLESTTKLKERQQLRADLGDRTGSSSSLGANEGRTSLRRKRSLRGVAPLEKKSSWWNLDHSNDDENEEKSERSATQRSSLGSQLETVSRKSPGRSRKKGGGNSIVSAPALSDKHRERSRSRKKVKEKSKKRSSSTKSKKKNMRTEEEEEDLLAKMLGMPTFEKTDDSQEVGAEGSFTLHEVMNGSMASLDPSMLTNKGEPVKRISSIHELYHNKDNEVGFEGELELNDGSSIALTNSPGSLSRTQDGPGIVDFDVKKLQERSPSGPGTLSPHSSLLSTATGDSSSSPGILKRKAGESSRDQSPSRSQRVSWVELPLTSPGTLVVKSTDVDGSNEREIVASLEEAYGGSSRQSTSNLTPSKKGPSLGDTLEGDAAKKKRQSSDDRTIGTTTTNSSDGTKKSGNVSTKKDGPVRKSKRTPIKLQSPQSPASESYSVSGGSRSSLDSRRSKSEFSDESQRSLSRKDNDDKRPKQKLTRKRSARSNLIRKASHTPKDKEGEALTPPKRRLSRRGSVSTKSLASSSVKAGSRIKHVPQKETHIDQSSGEPTIERTGSVKTLETTPVHTKRSYLNRRQLMKEHQSKSQNAKTSVMSSLDTFLERVDNQQSDATGKTIDNRSVNSETLLRRKRNSQRSRSRDGDDRSVSSAPMLNARRRRRGSEKMKRSMEAAMAW